ncbi:Hypothetical protein NTJ_11286 [Nesidiocoris tenuis]|uniref:Uncharacterized protein n=1 Tax=Nesidiocoris tenuis TaxID=355587 RepID=A0ABN7B242_9HEMI|nr:Hypothetical protein NTJ_11286 [Nesidiocoris tenuis]
MSRAPSEATSRSILLLIVYSLIDEKYAQQRLPGIDHCKIPWPGSCVTGQLTPQTRRFHFDETFDSSHSLLLPQQFENSSELSLTDVYDHHCNDHLENLVIPLAIIQGFRHAVATGKNSTRVNMSPPRQLDPSPTQNALTKPDIVKEVKIPMIHHHNEAGMADLESRDTKVRFKYGRAASDWDNDAVKVDSQTNDANERKMSSTCNEVGAPCCLNAVDFIACLLSNLSNATNASLLEEKEPLIKLSGIDSTMLNEKKLEKPLELMVSVKPKIWQCTTSRNVVKKGTLTISILEST